MIAKKMLSNCFAHVSALRNQSYVFERLNQSHANDSIKLLAKEFSDYQPLSNAYCLSFGLSNQKKLQVWTEFWTMFSEEFLTNQLSVGCFDASNGQLVGVSVANDLPYQPLGFNERIMKSFKFTSFITHLQDKLLALTSKKYQPLLKKKGFMMDIEGAALKKQHMGKRLLHKMMLANELLGAAKGYQYCYVYSTNFKTGVALSKLNYERIASFNAAQFEINGIRCFQKIEEPNKFPCLFLKKIQHAKVTSSVV